MKGKPMVPRLPFYTPHFEEEKGSTKDVVKAIEKTKKTVYVDGTDLQREIPIRNYLTIVDSKNIVEDGADEESTHETAEYREMLTQLDAEFKSGIIKYFINRTDFTVAAFPHGSVMSEDIDEDGLYDNTDPSVNDGKLLKLSGSDCEFLIMPDFKKADVPHDGEHEEKFYSNEDNQYCYLYRRENETPWHQIHLTKGEESFYWPDDKFGKIFMLFALDVVEVYV